MKTVMRKRFLTQPQSHLQKRVISQPYLFGVVYELFHFLFWKFDSIKNKKGYHSFILASIGERESIVYSMGLNSNRQVMRNTKEECDGCAKIPNLPKNIVGASCGYRVSAVLTEDGKVFVVTDTKEVVFALHDVPVLKNHTITSIACADRDVFISTFDKKVFRAYPKGKDVEVEFCANGVGVCTGSPESVSSDSLTYLFIIDNKNVKQFFVKTDQSFETVRQDFEKDEPYIMNSEVEVFSGTDCFNYPFLRNFLQSKKTLISLEDIIMIAKHMSFTSQGNPFLVVSTHLESDLEFLPKKVLKYCKQLNIVSENTVFESNPISLDQQIDLHEFPFHYFENLSVLNMSGLGVKQLPEQFHLLKDLQS